MPSPRRAAFQLSLMARFLDLDTDRPACKTRALNEVQEGRVTSEDVRSDQAVMTRGQNGPSFRTARAGSLGAGTASSTFGAGNKQADPTKRGAKGLGAS